ncbi:MAG: SAM-dependent methyltransferase [Betaproteobacteria bacterium]
MAGRQDKQGKRTAELTALARAAGRRDPTVTNPDFLAERLLDYRFKALLLPGLRQLARLSFERRLPGMYLYHQARTKYLDELFLAAISGIRQLVILGAGLDTRFYRFADRLDGIRVFEVDHPGTAAWKRERLHRLETSTTHVTFIAIDFNVERLGDGLRQAGYDPGATTFFLMEGVVMYLPKESVESTFAVIGSAAPGSSVAFDYVYRSSLERPRDFLGAEHFQRYVAHRDEPCRFGLDPQEVAPFLAKHGLTIVSNAGPKELSRLVPGALCDFLGIAHARRGRIASPNESAGASQRENAT